MLNSTSIDKHSFIHLQEQLKQENRSYKCVSHSKSYKIGLWTMGLCQAFSSWSKWKKYWILFFKKLNSYRRKKKYSVHKVNLRTDTNTLPNYFSNENFVIYTAIFGKYDLPQEPVFIPNNCHFYIVTDQSLPANSSWEKFPTEHLGENFKNLSNIQKNRFCKMFPHKLFPCVIHSIYIDGNIKPISDFTEFINLPSLHGLLTHAHKARNCAYEEIKVCIQANKGCPMALGKYASFLRKQHFPDNYGLLECNMLVRDHRSTQMRQLMQDWWNEFFFSVSNRDQVSLPYVLWKHHIPVKEIATLGENIELNDALRIRPHEYYNL